MVYQTALIYRWLDDQNRSCQASIWRKCLVVVALFLFVKVEAWRAEEIASNMNRSADPCEDFAQYSCGNFSQSSALSGYRKFVTNYHVIQDRNKEAIKRILNSDDASDPTHIKKLKKLYSSCMNTCENDIDALANYLSSTDVTYPTLNAHWKNLNLDTDELIVQFARQLTDTLFSVKVLMDIHSPDVRFVLQIKKPEFLLEDKHMQGEIALQKYYTQFAVALGATEDVARADAQTLVEFESKLFNIAQEEDSNRTMTLLQIDNEFPDLVLKRAVTALFEKVNVTLSENQTVDSVPTAYFNSLPDVLAETDRRTIYNYLGFKHAHRLVGRLTEELRAADLELKSVVEGVSSDQPCDEECIEFITNAMPNSLGKLFVMEESLFSESSKTVVEELLNNVKNAFRQTLSDSTWMSPNTTSGAIAKLDTMVNEVGYPENYDNEDINREYENYHFTDNFYLNRENVHFQRRQAEFRKLTEPVDKSEWILSPAQGSPYYNQQFNKIVIPAAVLAPPYFSASDPSAVRFGITGSFIAWLMAYGYTDKDFFEDGHTRNWLHSSDLEEYENRTKCVQEQIYAVNVPELNRQINNKTSVNVNMADIMGLNVALQAYKMGKATNVQLPMPSRLDFLPEDQLFFVAFAQVLCEKYTPQFWTEVLREGIWLPGNFRINGAMKNSPDFATAFNCLVSDPMNPEDKCHIL